MPVKTNTSVCPHRGAKWKTKMKTNTITEPTYSRNAEKKKKKEAMFKSTTKGNICAKARHKHSGKF